VAITVQEALQIDKLKPLRLVSGAGGLQNRIESVGILDYEYEATYVKNSSVKGLFRPNAFVLSSLLFAKDKPDKMIDTLRFLMDDGVSALAINTTYFKNLPQDALALSNENGFPVFLFDRKELLFETIITAVTSFISQSENYALLREKMRLLLEGGLSESNIRLLAEEILPDCAPPYHVLCCRYQGADYWGASNRAVRNLQRDFQKQVWLVPFDGGLFFVNDAAQRKLGWKALNNLVAAEVAPSNVNWGVGMEHAGLESFDAACKEAVYAAEYAFSSGVQAAWFEKLGAYQYILPYLRHPWFHGYVRRTVDQIKAFDERNRASLYETAVSYLENAGNIAKVAEKLHLHANSIRYRVRQLKDILQEESDYDFYARLSTVIKAVQLLEKLP